MVNVQPSGNAPSGQSIGTTVKTAGGNYIIVPPGTAGSNYNPQSGYWSVKADNAQDNLSNTMASGKNISDSINQLYQRSAEQANLISASATAKQYEYNSAEAQKNRDFQERMSNTAHQRQVQDLIKSGLNPVLSAMGSGATTPSGASASGQNYTGQKSEVDNSMSQLIGSMYTTLLSKDMDLQMTKINAATLLETSRMNSGAMVESSRLNSSASRYGSDRAYQSASENANWINRIVNSISSGQDTNKASNLFDSIKDAISPKNWIPGYKTLQEMRDTRSTGGTR